MNKENWYICTNYSALKNKEILSFGGHYVKWNKPDTKREILHDPTSMENTKKVNLWKHRELWLPQAGGWRKWGDVDQRFKDSLMQDE